MSKKKNPRIRGKLSRGFSPLKPFIDMLRTAEKADKIGETLDLPDGRKLYIAPENDPVSHPSHYTSRVPGIECIQVTENFCFNRGNAIKYIWRAGEKNPEKEVEDLEKAAWYINREIQRMKGEKTK